jgi:hypothetical protein
MDAGSLQLLHELIAMGSTSLLQYVSESSPFSGDAAHVDVDRVKAAAREERDEVVRLTRLLQKRHERLAKTGSYPSHFTTMNFVTLDYLRPKLIAETEREIASIAGKLDSAGDEEIRQLAENYLAMKRRHLEMLQTMGQKNTSTAA